MYLMVAGGFGTTLTILGPIAQLTLCKQDNKIRRGLSTLILLAMIGVLIWGSVVVFGKLNEYLTLSKK